MTTILDTFVARVTAVFGGFKTRRTRRTMLLKRAYEHVLKEYGNEDHASWGKKVGGSFVIPHPDDPRIEIEVEPIWDASPGGTIRVLVSVLHSTTFDVHLPTDDFFVYSDNTRNPPREPNPSRGDPLAG